MKLKIITSSEGIIAVAAEEKENLAREIRTSKLQTSEKIADRMEDKIQGHEGSTRL